MSVCEEFQWGVNSLGLIKKKVLLWDFQNSPEGKMCTFVWERECVCAAVCFNPQMWLRGLCLATSMQL